VLPLGRFISRRPFGEFSHSDPWVLMEFPLPVEVLLHTLLDLVLAEDPTRVNVVEEVHSKREEHFGKVGAKVPALFFKLAVAPPVSANPALLVDGFPLLVLTVYGKYSSIGLDCVDIAVGESLDDRHVVFYLKIGLAILFVGQNNIRQGFADLL
jgi:hypothetical protein